MQESPELYLIETHTLASILLSFVVSICDFNLRCVVCHIYMFPFWQHEYVYLKSILNSLEGRNKQQSVLRLAYSIIVI